MSAFQAFQIQEGNLIPFDPPWGSEETWMDLLKRQHYREEIGLALGRKNAGLRIEVHEAQTYDSRYLDFAFLILIYLGRTPHPVFCRDLSELLPFLQGLVPLIEAEMRCAGEETLLERLSRLEPQRGSAATTGTLILEGKADASCQSLGGQPSEPEQLLQTAFEPTS